MSEIITDLSFLRQKSVPVEAVPEAEILIEKVKETLVGLKNGVGVAAIQIGVPKKIAVIRGGKNQDFVYLINPELEEAKDEIVYVNEGCLSLHGQTYDTKRYRQITIKNQVIDGGKFREERQVYYYSFGDRLHEGYEGYENNRETPDDLLCISIQHELDHFSGKLITDDVVKREPIIRMSSKVGRNCPCSCGSGKKYKKCCGK